MRKPFFISSFLLPKPVPYVVRTVKELMPRREMKIEIQVVYGIKSHREYFFVQKDMPEIPPGIMFTGVTFTLRIKWFLISLELLPLNTYSASAGK